MMLMMMVMMKSTGMLMMDYKFVKRNKSNFGEKPDRFQGVALCLSLPRKNFDLSRSWDFALFLFIKSCPPRKLIYLLCSNWMKRIARVAFLHQKVNCRFVWQMSSIIYLACRHWHLLKKLYGFFSGTLNQKVFFIHERKAYNGNDA